MSIDSSIIDYKLEYERLKEMNEQLMASNHKWQGVHMKLNQSNLQLQSTLEEAFTSIKDLRRENDNLRKKAEELQFQLNSTSNLNKTVYPKSSMPVTATMSMANTPINTMPQVSTMKQLALAISSGDASLLVDLFATKEISINSKLENGMYALEVALKSNQWNVFKILLEKGADVNIKLQDNQSPLLYTCKSGNWDIARILSNITTDINLQDKDGMSAINFAAVDKQWDIVRTLVSRGAIVNYPDSKGGATAIHHIIAFSGDLELLIQTVKAGADINVKDKVYSIKNIDFVILDGKGG